MGGTLLFLYNSVHLEQVQAIYRLALEYQEDTGLAPWIDRPPAGDLTSATLGALGTVDGQISQQVRDAHTILYFLGNTGLGEYQETSESLWVKERLEAENPPIVISVLLEGAAKGDLPSWARERLVINTEGALLSAEALWFKTMSRLRASGDGSGSGSDDRPTSEEGRIAADILTAIEALGRRPSLTIFIGPYAFSSGQGESIGPASMTDRLLRLTPITGAALGPVPPWPSEAAEWASLAAGQSRVNNEFNRMLDPLGHRPPQLAQRIGTLAQAWLSRWRDYRGNSSWHGLLLLTTRVDLALESVLTKINRVPFTRVLPTFGDGVIENWKPDENWNPSGGTEAVATVIASEGGLSSFSSLEGVTPIILVKLCGTLDERQSLVLTTYDFFLKSGSLRNFPAETRTSTPPQLLLGRGFASPLAQLVRSSVLERRKHKQLRLLLMPNPPTDGPEKDDLCNLEMLLLQTQRGEFESALDATLERGSPSKVLLELARRMSPP